MRIVFVTAYPPSRRHPRSLGFLGALARRHAVTAVCLCHTPTDIQHVSELRAMGVQVMPVFEEAGLALRRTVTGLLSDQPLEVAYDDAPQLRDALLTELSKGDVSIVHVEHLRAASATLGIPTPVIWDAVSCVSLQRRLDGEAGPSHLARTIGHREASRVREYERQLMQAYGHIVVSTERDRLALLGAEEPHADTAGDYPWGTGTLTLRELVPPRAVTGVQVIPTGVDTDYFKPESHRRHHNRLVFSGALTSCASVAAVDSLLREIMPRVWKARPDVQVTIAGTQPPRRVQAYAHDSRVTVTGQVDDLRPYISGAAIAVAPFTYGTGVHHGILEAMASGTPVVATECAAAGTAAIPGRDLLVASSVERFAQLVLRVLEDEPLWRSVARSGRTYIERTHALAIVVRQLETLYSEASGYNYRLPSIGVPVPSISDAMNGW